MKLIGPKSPLQWIHSLTVSAFLIAVFCFVAGPVFALPISKLLNVNVIQVCNDSRSDCASLGPAGDLYFENEVDKIWAQAGIDVDFILSGTLPSSRFSTIDDASSSDHRFAQLSTPSPSSVTMWLVHTIAGSVAGEAWQSQGGLVIAMDTVMSLNRIDTIAHELGHNLGLDHPNNQPYQLMAAGDIRNVPGTLANIAPDGLGLDLLSQEQISTARRSSLLLDIPAVPEPDAYLLLTIGLAALIMLRSRFLV
jgi:hypothetical protein